MTQEELDDIYIVIKTNDAREALTSEQKKELGSILRTIRDYRASNYRPIRSYVVVSDVLECYGDAKRMVLEELNESE